MIINWCELTVRERERERAHYMLIHVSHSLMCMDNAPALLLLHFTSHRSLIKTEFRRWLVSFGSVYLLVKDIIIVVWRIYIKIEHQNLPEGKSLFFYLKSVCKAIRLRKVPGKVVGYWRLIFNDIFQSIRKN